MKLRKIAAAALLSCLLAGGTLYAADEQPMNLSADVLEYDSDSGLVQATGAVHMRRGDAVVTGSRAEYNSRTQEGRVTGGVVLNKEDLRMTAAEVRTSGNAHILADGGVVVKKADKVLTGPQVDYYTDKEYVVINSNARLTMADAEMTSDRIEAYLAENRVIAAGSVHIISQARNLDATSDKATYEGNNRGQVVLSGNAVAVQDGNTLRGNTITLYLGDQAGKQRE